MQVPLELSFRNMEHDESIEQRIREKVAWLEKFSDRITSCRVVVEKPHTHKSHGNLYHLRIDLTLPGKEIVVTRDPSDHHEHEDMRAVIRDAFDAARRQLQDFVSTRRDHHSRT